MYLIHWFPECSGGLCDRLLGLASSFCIAHTLKRSVLVKMDHGDLSPSLVLTPAYNWYVNTISYRYIPLTNFDGIEYFKKTNLQTEWDKEENIMIWSNVNYFNYLLDNPHFIDDNVSKPLARYEYIKLFSSMLEHIFTRVFTITPGLISSVVSYQFCVHIRTNDRQMIDVQHSVKFERYIHDIFSSVKKFITDSTCHNISQTVFIASDCQLSYKISKEYFESVEYFTGEIVHTAETKNLTQNGVDKVLRDLLTLSKCTGKLFIGWNSNFSRIPSLMNLERPVFVYEHSNDMNDLSIEKCTPDVLFSYFSKGKYV